MCLVTHVHPHTYELLDGHATVQSVLTGVPSIVIQWSVKQFGFFTLVGHQTYRLNIFLICETAARIRQYVIIFDGTHTIRISFVHVTFLCRDDIPIHVHPEFIFVRSSPL